MESGLKPGYSDMGRGYPSWFLNWQAKYLPAPSPPFLIPDDPEQDLVLCLAALT